MKKAILLSAVLFIITVPVIGQELENTIGPESKSSLLFYTDLGFGVNTRGANFDMALTATSLKGLGGSINFMAGFVNLQNVPSDYYDGLFRNFKPSSNFISLSFNIAAKFSNPKQTFRLGLEAGPSIIKYNELTLELNPDYPDLFEYKYNKVYTIKRITGVYCSVRAEIPALEYLGCNFILFGLINEVQSLVGFDITVSLGLVKKNKD